MGDPESPLPVLRLRFGNPSGTWLYVEPGTGRIREAYDQSLRLGADLGEQLGDDVSIERDEIVVELRGEVHHGLDGELPHEGVGVPEPRQDGVEETWRILEPLIQNPPPVHSYKPGTWGPAEAERLISAGGRRWHALL